MPKSDADVMRHLLAGKVLVLRGGDKVSLFRDHSVYRQSGSWIPTPARWNREGLEKHLASVREFQRRTKSTIYVGEFGCTKGAAAKDRQQWFRDCLAVFERWRWKWTVHAWREAAVWDVEDGELLNEIVRPWR